MKKGRQNNVTRWPSQRKISKMRNDQALKFSWGSRTQNSRLELWAALQSYSLGGGGRTQVHHSYTMSLRPVKLPEIVSDEGKPQKNMKGEVSVAPWWTLKMCVLKIEGKQDFRWWLCLHKVWKQTRQRQSTAFAIKNVLQFRGVEFLTLFRHFLDRFQFVKSHQVPTAWRCLCSLFFLMSALYYAWRLE